MWIHVRMYNYYAELHVHVHVNMLMLLLDALDKGYIVLRNVLNSAQCSACAPF